MNYRESYRLHASSGSSSTTNARGAASSSSPARSPTRVARIKLGLDDHVSLGNLDAQRDWGYAQDYVRAMWLMLQQDEPGRLRDRDRRNPLRARVLRDRVRARRPGLGTPCPGGRRATSARPRWTCSSATPAKAHEVLGWKPEVSFEDLVRMMVDADLADVRKTTA